MLPARLDLRGALGDPDSESLSDFGVHLDTCIGVDFEGAGSPIGVAVTSFLAFTFCAFVPLAPWLFIEGTGAVIASVVLGTIAAAIVGVAIAVFTERSRIRTAARQTLVAAGAAGGTFVIGWLLGVSVA